MSSPLLGDLTGRMFSLHSESPIGSRTGSMVGGGKDCEILVCAQLADLIASSPHVASKQLPHMLRHLSLSKLSSSASSPSVETTPSPLETVVIGFKGQSTAAAGRTVAVTAAKKGVDPYRIVEDGEPVRMGCMPCLSMFSKV